LNKRSKLTSRLDFQPDLIECSANIDELVDLYLKSEDAESWCLPSQGDYSQSFTRLPQAQDYDECSENEQGASEKKRGNKILDTGSRLVIGATSFTSIRYASRASTPP
jgi:hypothetical protein